ncbi:MAG: adenylosuccinate lyase [Saprospirales bacterium]|nr:MAG: adenylosuccinate lyase [Saprospirales bacterium]
MNFNLESISPIDGRYASKTSDLSKYFSESALIFYRLKVEVEYFKALVAKPLPQLKQINPKDLQILDEVLETYSIQSAKRIKEIEFVTNHDVKAVEYFLKEKIKGTKIEEQQEFIHFGLTSQDINNTAVPMSHKEALDEVVIPAILKVKNKISELAEAWSDVPMLAKTHGQPASPTRLGKEMQVFAERLELQFNLLDKIPHSGKFGGATGNFNAHKVAYPEMDWKVFADKLLNERLGLQRQQTTTQIEHYDNLAAFFQTFVRINNILTDFARDMWTYISMDYFQQKTIASEVGSSAMPHKVNPIDFENAEGNLGLANALFNYLANKLPISRLQRDLTDSTVLRNIGVPYGHMLISLKSLEKGISKLKLNQQQLNADLERNYMVVAEGIQNILRREGIANPYEQLKSLTRGSQKIGKAEFDKFIDSLEIGDELKAELKQITPFNYHGY